eukprot:CAMPEP_0202967564 /NCGR_PEP_ID=MMETSP1396-20130829/12470_1 /ASSEMBLY_ACC=CAM_ASM_000872 /TAXON_ID= /ORGANISM="Pseudokeronopsis sp., Strain Brazil" /LENGTH=61 /DNA_ID=CAMNT_0049692733 /DNA_START=124 /DNA_END=309 /DNA_ORIENTATION=+
MTKKAVEEMERNLGRDVLLGTAEGSLLALVEVPHLAFLILEQLAILMEDDPLFIDLLKKPR